jgi:hypothetical protein
LALSRRHGKIIIVVFFTQGNYFPPRPTLHLQSFGFTGGASRSKTPDGPLLMGHKKKAKKKPFEKGVKGMVLCLFSCLNMVQLWRHIAKPPNFFKYYLI